MQWNNTNIINDFNRILNKSIKIKKDDSIFFIYDRNILLKYKIAKLKDIPFNLSQFNDISFDSKFVIFEQDNKHEKFFIKLHYTKKFKIDYTSYLNIIRTYLNDIGLEGYIPAIGL